MKTIQATSKEGYLIEAQVLSMFYQYMQGENDACFAFFMQNPDLKQNHYKGWYEYTITVYSENDIATIDSIVEFYNGVQRLTKENAVQAVNDAIEEMKTIGVKDYVGHLLT